MPLNAYLRAHHQTKADFGKWVGISQSMVEKIANGSRPAPLDLIIIIERKTKGELTCEHFMRVRKAYLARQLKAAAND